MGRRLLLALWIMAFLAGASFSARPVNAANPEQVVDPAAKAKLLLTRLTPEEKVGQLFLVTFKGRDVTSKDSKIQEFITSRFLGGVLLDPKNDTFTGPVGTIEEAARLTKDLQSSKWRASQGPSLNPYTHLQFTPTYIPMLIGIVQVGDSAPTDSIFNGVTTLPPEMAIGATWNANMAEKVGGVLGTELQGLGINLLLGPSLDVQDFASLDGGQDLGARIFGGNPYWVGEMGKAFVRGVHQGSSKKVSVIVTSFPGQGSSDRSPDDEVATVKKSLDQLRESDLLPFFSVTTPPGSDSATDGMLVSHIRYQGLQGPIRSTTRPLSFDQSALDQALALPGLAAWRQAGGILVSSNLGSPSIRKFYDPTGTSFDGRQIARNAFLAGNDLMILDNFIASGDADPYVTLQRTLESFAQKYREDQAFAQRVDASVSRILTLKYRMYPDFNLDSVLPRENVLAQVGQSQQVSFDVASRAVTLVSPGLAELSQLLPKAPELRDRIFFISDTQFARQCTLCSQQPLLAVDALENTVSRLYGPKAGGQVQVGNLYSYTFLDLKAIFDNSKDQPPHMEEEMKQAEWIVLAATSLQPGSVQMSIFKKLVTDRSDLISNKHVILFSFGPPSYLDATNITKLTAYYALYGKSAAFVEVAARVLFQELAPAGALPISVNGAGYSLTLMLSPDPSQVIQLDVDESVQATVTPQPTPTGKATQVVTPTASVRLKVGDTLPLRTGVIVDHNKNPVPDGTKVRFLFTLGSGENSTQSQVETVTNQGIAKGSFRIPNAGILEIRVEAEPALSSKLLRLEISSSGTVAITAVTPTPLPSATPTVTPTSTVTPTATLSPTPTPVPPVRPGTGEWSLSLFIILGLAGFVFLVGRSTNNIRWGLRWAFLVVVGGWVGYLYVTMHLPGADNLLDEAGKIGILMASVAGCAIGWAFGLLWMRWMKQQAKMPR